ncbi:MAG TPA: c-type cytochrome [Azospirillum sp.]|nr:c-type cytochrome [Azospirillum sp.]
MFDRFCAIIVATVFSTVIGSSAATASEVTPGQALFVEKGCPACHGEDGRQSVDAIPILAGQKGEYLFKQMKDVADGRRVSGPDASGEPRTKAMKDVMGPVSEADMKVIAGWLATVPPPPVRDGVDAAAEGAVLYDEFGCIGCHGADGLKPLSDYPILAGQTKEYLALQLKEIRDDVRTNGRARLMIGFARPLTDAQAERIAEYLTQVDRSAATR